ncbi:MAG: flagellar protein FlgN [Clostridia bacterium]|nr:flagellar protein FlgN [Clostridia bacterium]
MRELVSTLILTLEKEEQIYKDVLELAKEKKSVLVDGKMKELEAITKKEQNYVVSLIKVEEAREKTVQALLKELNVSSVESIAELMGLLSDEEKLAVGSAKRSLQHVLKFVDIENQFNQKLIQQSLDLLELNLEIFTDYSKSGTNYQGSGVDQDKEKKSIFDVKV